MLKILLIDNDDADAQLLRSLLSESRGSCDVTVVGRLEEAVQVAAGENFDVIMLDLSLPDGAGLEALQRILHVAGAVPVVVLTESPDEPAALAFVQAGAGDYLVKGQLTAALLWRSLRYAVERGRAVARMASQAHLLDQVGQAVIATDLDGRIEYWNDAATRLYGWHADEVIGRKATDFMWSAQLEAQRPHILAALQAGRTWTGHLGLRRRDGTLFTAEVTSSPLHDAAGVLTGAVSVSVDITARLAAEDALRATEQRLSMFVERTSTLLWSTDDQMRITSVMGAALHDLPLTPAKLIGLDIRLLDEHAGDPGDRGVHTRRALAGESVSFRFSWGGRHFDAQLEPLRAPDTGAVIGTIGIALDVTQRHESERATLEYYELLRTIVDASPIAIIALDTDGRVTMWNHKAERMFGWTAEEVTGGPLPIIPERGRAEVEDRLAQVRAGQVRTAAHVRRQRRDGSLIDVAVTNAPIYDPDGSFLGTMGLLTDITAHKQTEEQQRRLTGVVEASPDFIGIFSADRRALYLNSSGRRMIGVSGAGDIVDRPLAEFYTPAAWELMEREAFEQAEREGSWTGETELATRSGGVTPVRQSMVVHRDADGRISFLSIAAHDLTERRRLEEQLRQAQKMDAIGRLAGGVAHDFNNLLTAIAGHTEMLLEQVGDQSPTARSDIEEVLRAADRAAGLTRQLLAFSRRQVLQPALLDVNAVVIDMERLLRRLIGEDVELVARLTPDLPQIRTDRSQLEQVIMNLVVNARDAMPDGGRIVLSTGRRDIDTGDADELSGSGGGSHVEIVVADSGTGMDADVLSRVFEPFFTTKEQGKGTGLGLPTVYGIVTQSGGRITVDSVPGEGSTFRVLLPSAPAGEPERSDRPPPESDTRGSETVLLVEDEHAVRRLGERILVRQGYTVHSADCADSALALFPDIEEDVTLLISDVVMPGMSGGELARRLTQMKPGLRVLFTSGYTADAIARHGVLGDGVAFLEKPFTPDAFARKVRAVLDMEAT